MEGAALCHRLSGQRGLSSSARSPCFAAPRLRLAVIDGRYTLKRLAAGIGFRLTAGIGLWLAAGGLQSAIARDAGYHWAYATHFGTGRYELDGYTETAIVGLAPSWTWREPARDDTGTRTIGYRFRLPVAIGAAEFASLDSIDELTLDSFNAISVVPGVEAEIPISERLTIKPLGYLGMGWQTHAGNRAGIFRFGLRTGFDFAFGDTRMQLVHGLERIGYSDDDGVSDALNLLSQGLDFQRSLAATKIAGAPAAISWHLMYTRYLDSLGLDLRAASLRPATLSSEWELGIAIGKQTGTLNFWRLRLDRIGIAYRFGSGGDFAGIGIVFRSLFDR